jgi:hypothetical protein
MRKKKQNIVDKREKTKRNTKWALKCYPLTRLYKNPFGRQRNACGPL